MLIILLNTTLKPIGDFTKVFIIFGVKIDILMVDKRAMLIVFYRVRSFLLTVVTGNWVENSGTRVKAILTGTRFK